MPGRIAALYRYPIKGFTPEGVERATLSVGAAFPGDRLFAVEDGPSGFNRHSPSFIPKTRFTVLARMAEVAKVTSAYDAETGVLRAEAAGRTSFEGRIAEDVGARAFATWLGPLLKEASKGPLRLLDGGGWRFLDNPKGHVSIINLSSLASLEEKVGRRLDPLRFRANLHVEGWPTWAENDWPGRRLRLGGATADVLSSITRCAAPSVDPTTAERDVDIPAELRRAFGHLLFGIYVQVTAGGQITPGSEARLI
ncbi:MAG: MOSC domain-containing protein [Caulobacteraceae bacterium]